MYACVRACGHACVDMLVCAHVCMFVYVVYVRICIIISDDIMLLLLK